MSTDSAYFFPHFSDFFLSLCAESGLFGVPLSSLLDQDQKRIPGTKVPVILQKVRHQRPSVGWMKSLPSGVLRWMTVSFCASQLISHIEEQGLATEGLLRIPGAATRVKVDPEMLGCCHCRHFYTRFIEVDIHILL